MSVLDNLEPHPPAKGETYEQGSPQWLERFEYIEARTERYFDNFREDIRYDFTKSGHVVQFEQSALLQAYENFAKGTLQALGVGNCAKMLLARFERKVATPPSPNEIAESKKDREYVPKWKQDFEAKKTERRELERKDFLAKQPSPDWTAYITNRGYRGDPEASPMPGLTCYSIDGEGGFYSNGKQTTKAKAYAKVLWERDRARYPEKADKTPVGVFEDEATPVAVPTSPPKIETLRNERQKLLMDAKLNKRGGRKAA